MKREGQDVLNIFDFQTNPYDKEIAVPEPVDEEEELGDDEGSKEDTDGSKGETQDDLIHVIDIYDYLV